MSGIVQENGGNSQIRMISVTRFPGQNVSKRVETYIDTKVDVPSTYTSQPIHATPNIDGPTPYFPLGILMEIKIFHILSPKSQCKI